MLNSIKYVNCSIIGDILTKAGIIQSAELFLDLIMKRCVNKAYRTHINAYIFSGIFKKLIKKHLS